MESFNKIFFDKMNIIASVSIHNTNHALFADINIIL